MWKLVLGGVAAAVAIVLIVAATRPDTFRVERSTLVAAPPERVFGLIDDLHQFNRWNPYAKKDPQLKQTYTGPSKGPGAAFSWEGEKVGSGSMEIAETRAPSLVAMKLDFTQPFEAHNRADFLLQPKAGGTRVTWALHGPMPFVSKLMGLFFSMDRMVGRDFEAGLADLKALAEAPPA